MLTIIYIYFNFTIIVVKIAYFAKTRHVDEMDGLGLVKTVLGWPG